MRIKKLFVTVILCLMIPGQVPGLFGQVKTERLVAVFAEGEYRHIYTVYCREKYETTFILPKERAIKEAFSGDPDAWEIVGKYGGRLISVKPLANAGQTSLTIVSQSMTVYKFTLVNIRTAKESGVEVAAIVEIREKTGGMAVIGQPDEYETKTQAGDTPFAGPKDEKTLARLNGDYVFHDRYFSVQRVYDDGVFTFIAMPGGRDLPAVYISDKKGKVLEPVRYVVKPGLLVIHRLIAGNQAILLRSGSGKDKKETRIFRSKQGKKP